METKIGGKRAGAGRPKIERKEKVRNTTVQVEPSVIDKCRRNHGSLGNALRYAAKHKS